MDLTGIGLYTLNEAERLTGAEAREVSRWLFGYTFKDRSSAPLWTTQLAQLDEKVIGFRDLLELRVVKAFRNHNVSLRVIRAAIENAKAIFGTEYPFTANRFLTDGRTVFYEALQEHGEVELTDLVKRQLVFEHIVRPELYAGIEFAADGLAKRWFPLKRSNVVVLDPEISFGKPVLAEYGVRTDLVVETYRVERSKKMAASLYGIPVSAVDAAIRYERRWRLPSKPSYTFATSSRQTQRTTIGLPLSPPRDIGPWSLRTDCERMTLNGRPSASRA